MKIYIVVNEDRFFLSHRKDIALSAKASGHDVAIVCKDTGQKQTIIDMGLRWIELPINPTGMHLTEEWRTLHFLYKLYKNDRPDIVHHVGLKAILWGTLAAQWAKIHGQLNAVCGLGVLFSHDPLSLPALGVLQMIKYATKGKNAYFLFQNHEDEALFKSKGIVDADNTAFIKGSGVDLDEFCYTDDPAGDKVRIMFTARMVKEKGTLTLIEAAELLRKEMEGRAEFILCGGISSNPKAISKEELEALCDGKYIRWVGHRSDVLDLLKSSHIMAFPSYYREGVPRSLIEAAALGRPIVTTNSIGCKDTVDDGENGFLIAPNDSQALAQCLRQLINNRDLRIRMGKKGRLKAEREFSIKDVVRKHLDLYDKLSISKP